MRNGKHVRAIATIAPGLVGAALLILASAGDASAACAVIGPNFRLSVPGPWPRSMSVKSGEACGGSFRAFGTAVFKRLNLIARPQNGTLDLRQGGHYTYRSKAGYHGADTFTLQICGGKQGANCADLKFDVRVE